MPLHIRAGARAHFHPQRFDENAAALNTRLNVFPLGPTLHYERCLTSFGFSATNRCLRDSIARLP